MALIWRGNGCVSYICRKGFGWPMAAAIYRGDSVCGVCGEYAAGFRPAAFASCSVGLSFFLIHPHVIYFVVHRQRAVVDRAAVVAAESEVQKDELLAVEGVYACAAAAAVHGLFEVYLVEQFAVEVYAYRVFIPVHTPYVELVRPVGIALEKVCVRYFPGIPYRLVLPFTSPCGVGEDVRYAVGVVVLHDVDLAVMGPRQRCAEKPYCGPSTFCCGYAGPYFEPPVAEGIFAAGVYRRGGVFGEGQLLVPIFSIGVVFGTWAPFAAGFDGEYAAAAASVVTLVILCFVVALETLFISPLAGIGTAVGGEFVAPYETVAFATICIGLAARRLRADVSRYEKQYRQ